MRGTPTVELRAAVLVLLLCLFFDVRALTGATEEGEAAAAAAAPRWTAAQIDSEFSAFKAHFGKRYASREEEERRRSAFELNVRVNIPRVQAQNPHARFGINEFSDLTPDEFAAPRVSVREAISTSLPAAMRHPRIQTGYAPLQLHAARLAAQGGLPASVDWRQKGAVTPVKNQGQCGSCYAFSTTGNIEGQWFLAGNALVALSEQEIVSCDRVVSFGCSGGFSLFVFTWLLDSRNGWIASEAEYPYVSGGGNIPPCLANRSAPGNTSGAAQLTGGKLLLPWAPQQMMAFVAVEGPLAVAMDATTLQSYSGGVITTCQSFLPDHEVLIVGYQTNVTLPGASAPIDVWIVKNSWGTRWGEQGYFRVQLGLNLCQLELLPNSAEVASSRSKPAQPPPRREFP